MSEQLTLRPPTASDFVSTPANYTPPTIDQLSGTWYVTHSSLPLWKSKRNVTLTYKPIDPTNASGNQDARNRLDDTVTYQTLSSDKIKTVHGIDTAAGQGADIWDWRGTGWLKVASSHWEILGYGQSAGQEWAVSYFASTLFTPAGIDIISKSKEKPSIEIVSAIKAAFARFGDAALRKLAEELFEVQMD